MTNEVTAIEPELLEDFHSAIRDYHFEKVQEILTSFSEEKAKQLLEAENDIGHRALDILIRFPPLHRVEGLNSAAFDLAILLIRSGAPMHKNRKGFAPLISAAAEESPFMFFLVIQMIQRKPCCLVETDLNNRTALHRAVRSGTLKTVYHLLLAGSDPYMRDKNNMAPVNYVKKGHTDSQGKAWLLKNWKAIMNEKRQTKRMIFAGLIYSSNKATGQGPFHIRGLSQHISSFLHEKDFRSKREESFKATYRDWL